MIEATNLHKSFGDFTAVDGISLSIPAGQTLGLLGPNGAGKTTTIKMLVGVLKPDQGKIVIDSSEDPSIPAVRMKVGTAPQDLAIYEDLTAEENLEFFGKLYRLSGKHLKERVDWALEVARLTDRRKDTVKTFSGGMKRRINLAVALIHDPPVLLLDEPTVGVDPQSRNFIFESIEELKKQGRTIVYTTHYMEEAQRLCDRIAIIDQGKILANGTIDEVIEKHGGFSTVEVVFANKPKLPTNLQGYLEGETFRQTTAKPLETFNKLMETGARFHQIKIERPNLEAVFLNLTGRNLRDE